MLTGFENEDLGPSLQFLEEILRRLSPLKVLVFPPLLLRQDPSVLTSFIYLFGEQGIPNLELGEWLNT